MVGPIDDYEEIWFVDTEFHAPPGDRPSPICLVAREFRSDRTIRVGQGELLSLDGPPYAIHEGALFVAYLASAELGCHLALGWPAPANVVDLYVEFRNITNGRPPLCGNGLLGALVHFGLDAMDATEKHAMQQLAIRGGPFSETERRALLAYCEDDVLALGRLFVAMRDQLDVPRALIRGEYMKAVANMEHRGVPIDVQALSMLRTNWAAVQDDLIAEVDAAYGVYEGRAFKMKRWQQWLAAHDIAWPQHPTGALRLDDDTFRDVAKRHPLVAPIRELRHALSEMRLADLSVGRDGRNRVLLSPFQSITGRNQPSNSRFIFGPSVWLRGLIRPQPGHGVAYIDWEQQEWGIAAALSRDAKMIDAYESGDPYLEFAKQAGAAPRDATKAKHGQIRELFKQCALAVQYGMGADSLAIRIGKPVAYARDLLHLHQETYSVYWRWSEAVVNHAMLRSQLHTVFGWTVRVGAAANPRSLRNFPMQANGAEALRLACIFATERGVGVCAPVHDALLIEAPLGDMDDAISRTQAAMADASREVLGGFPLRTEAKVIRYPEHYMDSRGAEMWARVFRLIGHRTGATS